MNNKIFSTFTPTYIVSGFVIRMMTPEFSRRMAKVVHTATWIEWKAKNWEKSNEAIRECEKAGDYDNLPSWIKALVDKCEKEPPEERIKKGYF